MFECIRYCTRERTLTRMSELIPVGASITDEDIDDARPRARALLLRRLEMVWEACEPHITGDGGKPDPRFIEAGLRCLDRTTKLYRLDHVQPSGNVAITATQEATRAALVVQVAELESRMPG